MGDILYADAEAGMMSKFGGGTSGYFGALRPRGADITDNGVSSGSVHFMRLFEAGVNIVSQGATRRGHFSPYLQRRIEAQGEPLPQVARVRPAGARAPRRRSTVLVAAPAT